MSFLLLFFSFLFFSVISYICDTILVFRKKVKNPIRALGLKRSSFGQSELDNAVSTYTSQGFLKRLFVSCNPTLEKR